MDTEAKALAEKIWALTGTGSDEQLIYSKWESKVVTLVAAHDGLSRAKALREAATLAHIDQVYFPPMAHGMAASMPPVIINTTIGGPTLEDRILAIIPQPAPKLYTEAEVEERVKAAVLLESEWSFTHAHILNMEDNAVWGERLAANRAAVKGRE